MTRARTWSMALLLMTLWLVSTPMVRAHANGVPTTVTLSYLDGLSNWGPRDASGTLELALGDGYAQVEAAGLQHLDHQLYEGWLVNSQTNAAISLGTFNATDAGTVSYHDTLPPIASFGFDLFIITVQPDPDDAPLPSSLRSIGGRFSLIGQRTDDGGTPGAVLTSGPAQLPNTGDSTLRSDILRVTILLGASGVSLAAGLRLARRHA